jgi:phthiocerol/phenolphthiocerol synthesis type-I polyketide synthase D
MAPRRALEILRRLLGQSATQVAAVPINWKQYREFHPAGSASPLLSELTHEAAEIPWTAGRTSERRDAILAVEPTERRQLLQSYLSEQVARALGLSPTRLELQQPLSELGLDSLMAVELKNRIAVDLKVNVPVVKFLQGFSVDQAVTEVLEQLGTEAADPTMPLAPTVVPLEERQTAERLLADLDGLSDAQVSALLNDMLANEKATAAP